MIRFPGRRLAGRLSLLAAVAAIAVACTTGGSTTSSPIASALLPTNAAESPGASPSARANGSPGMGAACPTTQPEPLAAGETRTVTIDTSLGQIALVIEADLSPIAAGNFVALAECGWYDGVVFHRVVPGFVIQGGDGQFGRTDSYDASQVGTGGPAYTIEDEPVTTSYQRGTVAMARTAAPNSVGSQFFIVLDDRAAESLADPRYNNYQIIGRVTAGMETVDAIAADADAEMPSAPVVMEDVTVTQP